MPYYDFVWTDEIIAHLDDHGVTVQDFEKIVQNPERLDISRSTGRPCCWGRATDGKYSAFTSFWMK